MTNPEAHIARLNAAYAAGYTNEHAVEYGALIPGDDVATVEANAKKLASVVSALKANQRPADNHYAPDDNDDVDPNDAATRAAFADAIGPHL